MSGARARIAVVGAGAWGTALACHLASRAHAMPEVVLVARSADRAGEIARDRRHKRVDHADGGIGIGAHGGFKGGLQMFRLSHLQHRPQVNAQSGRGGLGVAHHERLDLADLPVLHPQAQGDEHERTLGGVVRLLPERGDDGRLARRRIGHEQPVPTLAHHRPPR